jgi:hypothetical protein
MDKLDKIIKEILTEKKKKRDRCLRIADRKFDKPSAYKSGAVVRCRKGDIWKDLKEVIHEIIQEDESLHKWFKRSGTKGKEGGWVDCNAPIRKDGKIMDINHVVEKKVKNELNTHHVDQLLHNVKPLVKVLSGVKQNN